MRGAFRSEPKFLSIFSQVKCEALLGQNRNPLAIFPSLDARRVPARTEIPGGICQFECEASVGQNRNAWLDARRYSARTNIPGSNYQLEFEAYFRPGTKFLAMFSSLDARCLLVRTETPGRLPQRKCGAFVDQDRNS